MALNGRGPGGFMPPGHRLAEKNQEQKPQSLREVPGFLWRTVKAFFSRLFYVVSLVWETGPWILIFMVLLTIAEGFLPVLGSYAGAQILNALSEEHIEIKAVAVLIMIQFADLFASRIVSDINRILVNLSGELVSNHIRRKIMSKAKEIDIGCFDLPEFYETLENANREAGMRPIQILNSFLSLVSVVIAMTSFVVVLVKLNPWAPFLVALLALPSAIVVFIYRKKRVSYMRLRSKSRRQMNYFSSLVVNKDLVKELRVLDMDEDLENRYDVVFKDYFKGLKKLILSEGVWNMCFGVARILFNCLLFFFIARVVAAGTIRIGDYSFYTGALSTISNNMGVLITDIAAVYEGTLFIDNLISFMKQEGSIVPVGETPILPEKGKPHEIVFDHVSFRYPGKDHDTLKDINITFAPGRTVALVGLNGAGKTTLIKLLLRLYDPTEGTIYFDGKDIRTYSLRELYDLYGIVFQDFGRYAFTVEENIRFGDIKREPDRQRAEEAARQSDFWPYVEKMERGMDTPLMRYFEEDGAELSTGQWQKLAVARAFYGDKDILILDEPTASLDALAEQEIFNQFDTLRRGKTTVFVSHRLSSAVMADKIVVLSGGTVVEQGTHRELLAQKGIYAQMFTAQAERYLDHDEA